MTSPDIKTELKRKAIHFVNIWIPLSYIFVFKSQQSFVTCFVIISVISIIIDLSRKRNHLVKRIFNKWFDFMLKDHEIDGRLTGATWTFISVVFVGAIFPKDITILALLFLNIGDPVAAIIGMKFGKTELFGKTLEGTLAGIVACIIVTLPFSTIPLWSRIFTSVWTMLMELLPWPIDDNIIIPISAASMFWLLG